MPLTIYLYGDVCQYPPLSATGNVLRVLRAKRAVIITIPFKILESVNIYYELQGRGVIHEHVLQNHQHLPSVRTENATTTHVVPNAARGWGQPPSTLLIRLHYGSGVVLLFVTFPSL